MNADDVARLVLDERERHRGELTVADVVELRGGGS